MGISSRKPPEILLIRISRNSVERKNVVFIYLCHIHYDLLLYQHTAYVRVSMEKNI